MADPAKRPRSPSAASDALPPPSPAPTAAQIVRACTPCHARKVRCDGAVPYCTPCYRARRTDTCDVHECVVWSHSHILRRDEEEQAIRKRLAWLESEFSHCTGIGIGEVPTGESIQARLARPEASLAVDPLAFELGMLALEAGSGLRVARYVGTASGLTVARMLSALLQYRNTASEEPDAPASRFSTVCAGIPPLALARRYLTAYIDRIHRWYPVLELASLIRTFEAVYPSPSSASSSAASPFPAPFARFTFFMVLAIGSAADAHAPVQSAGTSTRDSFVPLEYLNAALTSANRLAEQTNLDTVVFALLISLYGMTDPQAPSVNLWQWTGYALRTAVELGCSRPARPWQFDAAEKERRRRVWWTAYRLERMTAVRLGRVLSMRNEGIDAEYPIVLEEPTPSSALLDAPLQLSLRPALHLVRLARLQGNILESVYIARPLSRPSMSQEETLQRVWAIQKELVEWAGQIPSLSLPGSPEANTLTLAFHRTCLLLHRPSPSFPQQPQTVHTVCITSCRAAINLGRRMLDAGELPLTWASLHDAFLDGLVLIYCSWASPLSDNALSLSHPSTDPDILTCLDVLALLAARLPAPTAERFVHVFRAVLAASERPDPPLSLNLNNTTDSGVGGGAGENAPHSPATQAALERVLDLEGFEGWEEEGFELDRWAVEAVQSLLGGEAGEGLGWEGAGEGT
ncbi:hypothetical protein JCM10207_001832 [Rhodosporidiobolus poonsookiae]